MKRRGVRFNLPGSNEKAKFASAAAFSKIKDFDDFVEALYTWLVPTELVKDTHDQRLRLQFGVSVGSTDISECAVHMLYKTGQQGKSARQYADVKSDCVAISIGFEVNENADMLGLGELSACVKDLLALFAGNLVDFQLESRLVTEANEGKIMVMNLIFQDRKLLNTIEQILEFYSPSKVEALLSFSQSPSTCRSERDQFVEMRLRFESELGRDTCYLLECIIGNFWQYFNAKNKDSVVEGQGKTNETDKGKGKGKASSAKAKEAKNRPTERAVADLLLDSLTLLRALKRCTMLLEFDTIEELYGRLFGKQVRSEFQVINWHSLYLLINSYFQEVVITGTEETENITFAFKELLQKLEYLDGLHSIRFIAGDHVLQFSCTNMDIFSVLPSSEELELMETQTHATKPKKSKAHHDRASPRSNKTTIKLMLSGDEGVGKTSLIQRYVNGRAPAKYRPTIGADVENKTLSVLGRNRTLQVWDTPGKASLRSGTDRGFYKGADCLILVFDFTHRPSFLSLDKHYQEFLSHSSLNDASVPVFVVGNKIDNREEAEVTKQEAEEWCKDKGPNFVYCEASALRDRGVQELFTAAAECVLQQQ